MSLVFGLFSNRGGLLFSIDEAEVFEPGGFLWTTDMYESRAGNPVPAYCRICIKWRDICFCPYIPVGAVSEFEHATFGDSDSQVNVVTVVAGFP